MSSESNTTASDRVYKSLRDAILDRSHTPGAILRRTELAQTFGTSQTPVREALLRLEREGLVLVKPQSGTVVSPIRVVDLHQAHFLRQAVEVDVVRRLATRPNRRDLSALKDCVSGEPELAAFGKTDDAFHAALFEAVGMERLRQRIAPLLLPLERCRALTEPDAAKVQSSVAEHRDILSRIEVADAKGAGLAMKSHLSGCLANLSEWRKEFPEMFDES